ncbi:OmpA family protein [Saprospira sp. CCB-QB6]|uniref:OmpA family protein n=1 Tax=Saprospira sp. CCB-QB6 TaxID=3023936 RepID=UPI002349C8AF|nr:OmpA family protein [Saprospira sp. CCB-QB6]WCL82176.1 OmpA family protein [Saprospira sp. CCB-QB6]
MQRIGKKLLLTLGFGLLLGGGSLSAQSAALKKAQDFYHKKLYKEAVLQFETALGEGAKEEADLLAQLAESYALCNELDKALAYYKKRILIEQGKENYYLPYARLLKSKKQLDAAQTYLQRVPAKWAKEVKQELAAIEFIKKEDGAEPYFSVFSLDGVNSKSADFAPLMHHGLLLFSSSRSVAVKDEGVTTWTNDAFNQYYYLALDEKGEPTGQAQPLHKMPSKDINDAPMAYSPKEDWLAISSNNYMDGLRPIPEAGLMMDIYFYPIKKWNSWDHSQEQFFQHNSPLDNKTPYSTGQACFNQDGSALYFTSNRPGGYGGFDIYVSFRTKNGWGRPQNLGPAVNTAGHELHPFMDSKGRLFFASDGQAGYGGLDLFTVERYEDGVKWGNLTNLGPNVNTAYDELSLYYDAEKEFGFFSSNRPAGQGHEDLYRLKLERPLPAREPRRFKPGDKLILVDIYQPKEVRLDKIKNDTLDQLVQDLLRQKETVIQIYAHTDSKGSYRANLLLAEQRAKAAYEYLVSRGVDKKRIRYQGFGEKYLSNNCKDGVRCSDEEHRANRRLEFIVIGRISEAGQYLQEYMPAIAVAEMDNPQDRPRITSTSNSSGGRTVSSRRTPERKSHYAIGDYIKVANIYYEHDKTAVDKNSPGLKELLKVLQDHPHVKLEIGSHTDATGSKSYNQRLSQERATAVKNYLVGKGIPASRLVAKGYGESEILNHCKDGVRCSKAEHAVNRRTEFKVIGQSGFKYGDIIKVDNINYATNSAVLDKRDMRGLNEIVRILKANSISVEIRSHTDSRGSAAKNLDLSERRAKAVYDYLIEQGVSKFRLKYKGYGETLPLNKCKDGVPCSSKEHAVNRRTDFKVIGLK